MFGKATCPRAIFHHFGKTFSSVFAPQLALTLGTHALTLGTHALTLGTHALLTLGLISFGIVDLCKGRANPG